VRRRRPTHVWASWAWRSGSGCQQATGRLGTHRCRKTRHAATSVLRVTHQPTHHQSHLLSHTPAVTTHNLYLLSIVVSTISIGKNQSLSKWLAGWRHERSNSTSSPVSTGMGDRLRARTPPQYVTKPIRSTQFCIRLGSLNRGPVLLDCEWAVI